MENLSDYIGVFTQAPLAVIVLVFIYLSDKQKNKNNERNYLLFKDMITKIIVSLDEAIKIIKQQERK